MMARDGSGTFAEVPPKLAFVGIALAGAVYFLCKGFGYPEAGRVAGFSVGVFVGVIAMCRPLWKTQWLWGVLLVFALLHCVVIVRVHWPEIHYPTLLMAPFAFGDFFVMIGLIKLLDKSVA